MAYEMYYIPYAHTSVIHIKMSEQYVEAEINLSAKETGAVNRNLQNSLHMSVNVTAHIDCNRKTGNVCCIGLYVDC